MIGRGHVRDTWMPGGRRWRVGGGRAPRPTERWSSSAMPAPRDVRASLDAAQSRRRWRARQMQVWRGWEARRQARAQAIEVDAQRAEAARATSAGPSSRRPTRRRTRWSRQLCLHEWLVSLPSSMAHRWKVAPRPIGPRCVLVSRRAHHVDLYDMRERHLGTFRARLPERTVLDVVFCAEQADQDAAEGSKGARAWLCDVLCWHGRVLLDCTASLRHFWLESRMEECRLDDNAARAFCASSSSCKDDKAVLQLATLPWTHADASGVQLALERAQDGLVFVHVDSRYEPGMRTPLVLRWKDEGCSPYAKDTDAGGMEAEACMVVLRVDEEGNVRADGMQSNVLAVVDEPSKWCPGRVRDQAMDVGERTGRSRRNKAKEALVRFVVHELVWKDGQVVRAKLEPIEQAGKGRKRADDVTKVIFQYNLRHDPITRHQLLEASAQAEVEEEWSEDEMCIEPENSLEGNSDASESSPEGSVSDATLGGDGAHLPDALYRP